MNRINSMFLKKKGNILSIYFTAGFPSLDSTVGIIKNLAGAGADIIEIGMPFSDPVADGPIIQESNRDALRNGMNMHLLFEQLKNIRKEVSVPLLLMGYLNPVLKFGIDNFCNRCSETGIDGIILPDLPPEVYVNEYSDSFRKYNLLNIFLISPQSDIERIRYIDNISKGFIYMVSSSSTTGIKAGFSEDQRSYFRRIKEMKLKNPCLIGFGISDNSTFVEACMLAHGAVIGSAFISMLEKVGDSGENIKRFINNIRNSAER